MIICVVKKITGQITDLLAEADIEESKSQSAIRHRTFWLTRFLSELTTEMGSFVTVINRNDGLPTVTRCHDHATAVGQGKALNWQVINNNNKNCKKKLWEQMGP